LINTDRFSKFFHWQARPISAYFKLVGHLWPVREREPMCPERGPGAEPWRRSRGRSCLKPKIML